MAPIGLSAVRKSFGRTEVIHGVDLDIADGELIVIVGPSGCGKSTLLRMVAGLETVTDGEVAIDGKRVNDLEPMERNIAMVFQNYALYPHMSVFDNMAYGLKIARTPKAEIQERVHSAARLLQLEEFLTRKPRQLSGGQRQRVAMGRAIVRKPAVFLFDEPLSNLDAKLRVQMRLEIKALQRDLGVTALYVTHDQVEAMTLADRMVVMNAGNAEQIGTPLDVYANPETEFVAGFIGSPPMNFLKLRSLEKGDGDFDGIASRLGLSSADSEITIGIRPEHLTLSESGQLSGTLKYAEALGAETLVHLEMSNGAMLTVRQDGSLPMPAPGAKCFASFGDKDICLFGADGKRIHSISTSEPSARNSG